MFESQPTKAAGRGRVYDVAIAACLAIAGAYCVWLATGLGNHISTLLDLKSDDVWFEADVMRVVANMTDRHSDHFRTQVHPLFSLFGFGLTHFFLGVFPGVGKLGAVRLAIALPAALWLAGFFALLRILGCLRLDATIFSLVAATSSAAFFWTSVPETYLLGSFTLVLVLIVTALGEHRKIPVWLDLGMAAAGLSMLVTNWMLSLLSLLARHRFKAAVQIAVNAFVAVVFIWVIQKFLFPTAHFFMGDHERWPHVSASTVPAIFFLDTLVMPDILSIPNDYASLWPKLSVQGAPLSTHTFAGIAALAAWIVLLIQGAYALVTVKSLKKFRWVLGLGIAGQLALHLLYGNESFLYALNWLPLLVSVAALGTFTRFRWVGLAAALVFIVFAAQHNFQQLEFAFQALAAVSS